LKIRRCYQHFASWCSNLAVLVWCLHGSLKSLISSTATLMPVFLQCSTPQNELLQRWISDQTLPRHKTCGWKSEALLNFCLLMLQFAVPVWWLHGSFECLITINSYIAAGVISFIISDQMLQ
jgi:hypothetical protein